MTTEEIKDLLNHLTSSNTELICISNGIITAAKMYAQNEEEVTSKGINGVLDSLLRIINDINSNNNQMIELQKNLY